MLAGQDLGRGQERSLEAVLPGQEQGQEGHDGLAAADLALQQALHGPRRAQVVDDGAEGGHLFLAEPERQAAVDGAAQASLKR